MSLFPRPKRSPARIEDALRAVAERELKNGEVRPEVWEIAIRLARGDDRRAASAYIRLRVRALLMVHEARSQTKQPP